MSFEEYREREKVIVEDHHQIPSTEGVAKSTPKKRRRLVGRQMKQSTPIFELTPRNPHASDRYTGGSSSGPAAIVASRLCSAALGTDGGGSVRIPSSLCGVVSLKTTYGRTNMKGSLCDAGTVEIIGPIAANVEDVMLVSLCDAGTVEIIGPIAANVEDVMLVYASVLGSSPSDRISLRSVHAALSEKEKVNVCYGLNYDTLSSEVYKHLTQNKKFPSKSAVQTLISLQCNLKSLRGGTDHPNPFIDSSCSFVDIDIMGKKDEACEQILLYERKLDLPAENEKLRANLQGMQWRVAELEKLRAKMQNQMTKMLKSRSSSHRNGRSLPRLCS